jgi:hypothetical protein
MTQAIRRIGKLFCNKSTKLDLAKQNFEEMKSTMLLDDLEIVNYTYGTVFTYQSNELEKLRPDEIISLSTTDNSNSVKLVVSRRFERKIDAILGLLSVVLLSMVMLVSIYLFNRDMYKMILNPLERLITKLKKVAQDPIGAFKSSWDQGPSNTVSNKESSNETILIENAIYKISELLVLGFGQAGAKIISQFVFDKNKDIDQIGAGDMVQAIFGFCDIRNFTDATEVLLEEVMVFVNSIAEIVHSSVDEFK